MQNKSVVFHDRVLAWFQGNGRKDLPWQINPTPYRVWISEIMLQQTQVTTVIPYFERFMVTFPTLESLAASDQDQVLKHWSGLGYYARARNLHRTAKIVVSDYDAQFPEDLESLVQLPGIGRSTAGAIQALAQGQRGIILDGNVKRVLCRFYAVEGWPGKAFVSRQLWKLAEQLTPHRQVDEYTQAMMDLGATLCTRTRPDCAACPLATDCDARQDGNPQDYPHRKPKSARPEKATRFLMLQSSEGEYLLSRRPQQGIWGGLWCFPELAAGQSVEDYLSDKPEKPVATRQLDQIEHQFTHFKLQIQPLLVQVDREHNLVREMAETPQVWYKPGQELPGGCPAPVTTLLKLLEEAYP